MCVRAKLAAAMASCVFRVAWKVETPLAQKRGGAKHIRIHRTRRFSKVAPMRNLKRSGSTRYQVASRSHAFSR